ncbi:MAG: hypothetical protein AAFZ87_02575 [Planctomycetota bacterium]
MNATALLPALLLASLAPVTGQKTEATVPELSVAPILRHELDVFAVEVGPAADRLFTVDRMGIVRSFEVGGDGAVGEEPAWESTPSEFGTEMVSNVSFGLSIGVDRGTRIGPGAGGGFDVFDLAGSVFRQSMGAMIGDVTDLNATKDVAVDPKDRWAWVAGKRGVARLMLDGSLQWSTRGMPNGGSRVLAIGPKGNDLAVGGEDGSVRFVGNKSCKRDDKTAAEGHADRVVALAWHPKGKLIASASRSDSILIHKRSRGRLDATLTEKGAKFVSLAIEPKGKWLAAGTTGGEVLFFELKKGTLIARAELEKRAAGHSLAFVGGGKRLVAASLSAAGLIDVESVGK